MGIRKRRFGAKGTTIALTAALLTVAGLAIAQERIPYYRFGANPATTMPGGPSLPSPWTPPVNDKPLEIGKPTVTSYTVRALVGEPVSLTMATSGGSGDLTWQPGAMPQGLGFQSGVISGTPEIAGKTVETVTVKDAQGKTAQGRVTFDIVEPVVAISGVRPFARVGAPLDGLVASNVANPEYAMRGVPGATLGAAGTDARAMIAGTLSAPGTFPLTVDVTRPGTSVSASASREVIVENPLEIAFDPPSIPALLEPVDVAISPRNVGGTPTLTLTSPSASVLSARGLSYSNGRLSGTLKYGSAANLSLKLKDSADGSEATATLRIPEVINGASSLVIAGEMRQGTAAKASAGSTATATVRTEIPSPRCTTTQAMPGISVSATCVISGTASTAGDHTLALTIVPASNPGATPVPVSAPVKVHPALTMTMPSGGATTYNLAPGESLDVTPTVGGVIGKTIFDLSGTTPAQLAQYGLSFNSTTGGVSGIPMAGTDISFGIRVRDSYDQATAARAITVRAAAPTLSASMSNQNLRSGDVRTYVATTNIPSPTFSLENAPSYVGIDSRLGVITVSAPEVSAQQVIPAFALKVVSEANPSVSKRVELSAPGVIRPELKLEVASTANGRGNVELRLPFTTGGVLGNAELRISSGSLPTGVILAANEIQGAARTPGTYPVTLRLVDSSDNRLIERPISIVIGPSLDIAFAGPVSPVGKGAVNQPFSVTATAQNAAGPVTFANVAKADRPVLLSDIGLSISEQGVIQGTPTGPLVASVNIEMTEVADGVTTVIRRDLALSIAAPQTAAGMYPVATYNGGEYTAHLYDAATTTAVAVPASGVIRLQYADPVTVNGIGIESTGGGNVYIKNVSTGQSFNVTGLSGHFGITQSTSDSWEISVSSSRVFQRLRLTYGGAAPTAPSFNIPTSTTATYALTGANWTLAPSALKDASGEVTWTFAGDPPAGTSFSPTNGAVSGTLDAVGDYTMWITATDDRGISSVPMAYRTKVYSGDTAEKEFPTITSTTTAVSSEDILAQLYDNSAETFFPLRDVDTLTFTFSKPVTVESAYLSAELSGYTGSPGSYAIVAVDEGKSFSVSSNGNAGLSGQSPSVATSRTWTVRGNAGGHSYIKLKQFLLRRASLTAPYPNPVAPNIKYTTTSTNLNKGTYYTISPSSVSKGSLNGVALEGEFKVIAGELPEDMHIDPATGNVFGSPSELRPLTNVTVAFVSTIPGVRSLGHTMAIGVVPAEDAGKEFPSVSASPALTDPDRGGQQIAAADLLGYAYTGSTTTSRFSVPLNQMITLTYDKPVKVSTLHSVVGGTFTLVNNDTGEELLNATIPPAGYQGFAATYGRSFTITSRSATTARSVKLGWSGTTPSAPYLLNWNTNTRRLVGQTFSTDLGPTLMSGAVTYQWSGLPSGLSVDATGKIVGSTTEVGTFVGTIRGTDSRGLSTAPITASVTVYPDVTAQNTIATASAYGGKDSADVSAALMDTSGLTTVSLAPNETITFSYPGPTLTTGIYTQVVGISQTIEVRDSDNVVRFSGLPSTGAYTWNNAGGLFAPNGTNASMSPTYTVKNIGSAPIVLSRMMPHYLSVLPDAVTYPNVNANATYGGIPRTGAYTVNPLSALKAQGGVVGWTKSGDLPTGFDFDASTGAITRLVGAQQAEAPETKTVIVSFTDGRGLSAMKWAITLQVN